MNPTLFCPQCGYNLRGTPGGSCPECGEPFDPVRLHHRQQQIMDKLGLASKRIMMVPIVCFMASIVPLLSLVLAPVAGLVMLIFSCAWAWELSQAAALTRAVKAQTAETIDRRYRYLVFAGFWLGQILLGAFATAGGCAVAIGMLQ